MKRNLFVGGLFIWLMGLLLVSVVRAQTQSEILLLTVDGPVTPVMLSYIERGIEAADQAGAEAIILQLNTPGGQIDMTRQIVQVIVGADVPLVVYVYPPGGFAASAGTFITLAGHGAAMAPQTSIGAASPVDSQGSDIDETLRSKIENILMADIENLAERRGEKALEWAKEAVTEAKAASANEALELGIIDFIATDAEDLVRQMDGFEVTVRGEPRQLATEQATLVPFEMTLIEQILATILRPEIAFILLTIGPLAIIYELANPGGFVSGVVGIICLILGLYALGQLPINYAGLGLVVLAFVLFGAEVFTPTHGALTLAGVISLFLGGLLLFDTTELDYRVSIVPVAAVSISLGAIFFFIIGTAVRSLKRKPTTGAEGLIGATGVVKKALAPKGVVFVDGARWQASLINGESLTESGTVEEVEEGALVEVVAVNGLSLKVRKKA